ncbi:MAG: alcohol dehydrogenase catalytic domain-containing protein [Gammaproteobacteria bacterium]|nr:alcohol dehydrogenase catalytic domain-containing protein [Gammaproteobacteria bacterium]
MKALVYTAAREIQYRDAPAPARAPGEVLVDIEAVGICGSDMHAYLGHDPRRVPPLILGHEAVGTVVAGPGAGQRAVLNPLIACGVCDECLGGRQNLCPERDLVGMYRPGAFAERISIPERNLVPIPPDMDVSHAALTEPAATSLHAVRLAGRISHRPLSETRALVIGAGSIGLFAALALADHGAARIDLAETNRLRRDSAARTGAVRVLDPAATPPQPSAYDLVVDAVGGRSSRATASAAVRPGGIIVHIGLLDNEGGLDLRRMTLHEITCIGTYTYTPVDLRAAVAKLHTGAFGDLAWIEQRPLSAGPGAFDDLLHGRTAAAKIVLRP